MKNNGACSHHALIIVEEFLMVKYKDAPPILDSTMQFLLNAHEKLAEDAVEMVAYMQQNQNLLHADWGQALSLSHRSGTFSFASATANLLLMEYPDPFLPLPKTRDKVQKTISYFILQL